MHDIYGHGRVEDWTRHATCDRARRLRLPPVVLDDRKIGHVRRRSYGASHGLPLSDSWVRCNEINNLRTTYFAVPWPKAFSSQRESFSGLI